MTFCLLPWAIDIWHKVWWRNEMMPFQIHYWMSNMPVFIKENRSVKKTMALWMAGLRFLCPIWLYGRSKNKRQLLVDRKQRLPSKRIFELSKQGNNVHQIARALCEDGILIPRAPETQWRTAHWTQAPVQVPDRLGKEKCKNDFEVKCIWVTWLSHEHKQII